MFSETKHTLLQYGNSCCRLQL